MEEIQGSMQQDLKLQSSYFILQKKKKSKFTCTNGCPVSPFLVPPVLIWSGNNYLQVKWKDGKERGENQNCFSGRSEGNAFLAIWSQQ